MKRKIVAIMISTVIPLAGQVSATVIDIPNDYQTIQQGINASENGDTVLVQPGLYMENINFRGHNIVVGSLFLTTDNPVYIAQTIIDGSQPDHPDTASCVIISSGEDASAVLTGFTLTGGTGTVWRDIHNFLWYREGGGILIELSSPTIRSNIIMANEAIDDSGIRSAGGGGMRIGDSNSLVEGNIIYDNVGLYGGGIVLNYSTGVIRGNLIFGNGGGEDYGGGGIWTTGGGQTIIENNTVVNNNSALDGGGLLVWGTSVSAVNNIFYGNTDNNGYPQIRIRPGSNGSFRYNDIEGGWSGEGNIDCNPAFCDPESNFYYLAENSCCVGAGENGADIGAFGVGCEPTGIADLSILPRAFVFGNYPNPFNGTTSIEFNLIYNCDISLTIYNLTGESVAELAGGYYNAGRYSVSWNASKFPSGIYFARLIAGTRTENIKMLLLK